MKKLGLYVFVHILLVSVASAALDITEVEVTVDGDDERNADKDGGDIEVLRNSRVKFRVSLENTFSNQSVEDMKVRIRIDNINNGNDITEDTSNVDIDVGDKRSRSVSITIPSDAIIDTYDAELRITGRENTTGTDIEEEIFYEIQVESGTVQNVQTTTQLIIDLNRSVDLAQQLGTCQGEQSGTKETIDAWRTSYNNEQIANAQCRSWTNQTNADITTKKSELATCQERLNNMITRQECENIQTTAEEEKEKEGESGSGRGMILLAIVGWWWFYGRKQKDHSAGSDLHARPGEE